MGKSPSGSDAIAVQLTVSSLSGLAGEILTELTLGFVFEIETEPLLVPWAPSVSTTVTVHWIWSPTEAAEGVSVKVSLVLSRTPVFRFSQAWLNCKVGRSCGSGSIGVDEQTSVSRLVGLIGAMLTEETYGAAFTISKLKSEGVPKASGSAGVTVTVQMSPFVVAV